jgi:serine/threonine protein kinase
LYIESNFYLPLTFNSSLKPENVLIDMDGYTKLCDFGLSVMLPNGISE